MRWLRLSSRPYNVTGAVAGVAVAVIFRNASWLTAITISDQTQTIWPAIDWQAAYVISEKCIPGLRPKLRPLTLEVVGCFTAFDLLPHRLLPMSYSAHNKSNDYILPKANACRPPSPRHRRAQTTRSQRTRKFFSGGMQASAA